MSEQQALQSRIHSIEERILNACQKSGRKREELTVIAVTKSIDVQRTQQIIEHGYPHLGENRDFQLVDKYESMKDSKVDWHFIGNVQSRKVKDIVPIVSTIHSLQSLSVAKQIEKRADHPIECFIQVNISEEASKSGLMVDEVIPFIEQLSEFKKVVIVGLMTMAPYEAEPTFIRSVFKQLKELQQTIASQQFKHAPCHYLSMGMSNDFEIAIEEGATHLRIGTALVGN